MNNTSDELEKDTDFIQFEWLHNFTFLCLVFKSSFVCNVTLLKVTRKSLFKSMMRVNFASVKILAHLAGHI